MQSDILFQISKYIKYHIFKIFVSTEITTWNTTMGFFSAVFAGFVICLIFCDTGNGKIFQIQGPK